MENFIKAIQSGDLQAVEAGLASHPEWVNARSATSLSAVLAAMYYGHPQIADLLVQRGANLDLFEACAVGALAQVRALTQADASLVNAFASDGFQPLGLAAFFGHLAVAQYLVEQGAEVNSGSHNGAQVMPLHSAVASRSLEIARLLLDHGADANARQADDFVPIHGAAQNGQVEMLALLLAHGADLHLKNKDGLTALMLAQKEGHTAAAEFLQHHGAQV